MSRTKSDDTNTTQVRITLDNKILEHFERQAQALGIKVSAMILIALGERYQQDLQRLKDKKNALP